MSNDCVQRVVTIAQLHYDDCVTALLFCVCVCMRRVVIYSKTRCPFCLEAKRTLTELGVNFTAFEIDVLDNGADVHQALKNLHEQKTVPYIFINQVCVCVYVCARMWVCVRNLMGQMKIR